MLKSKTGNYMVIHFDLEYNEKLVLPYKDGVALLAALEQVKVYKDPYNEASTIKEMQKKNLNSHIIGDTEYAEASLRNTLLAENTST